MRILLWALLVILCPAGLIQAQTNIRPLTIGDTIPADLILENVANYPVSKIQLSALKGKLVILDFWATWCGACVAGIPKAQELQKQFKNKVQIIMVNSDTSEYADKVTSFFNKRNKRTGQKIALPYAVQNALLNNYFPHTEVPHYVWLNKTGKVAGITTAEEVSAENISAFLEDSSKILLTKKDHLRFNPDKPLLIDENGGDNPTGFIYRSLFTGYKENLGASGGRLLGPEEKTVRYYFLNSNLLVFFKIAYRDIFKNYTSERIFVESSQHSGKSILDPIISQLPENRFCYEIIMPTVSQDKINLNLQQDIIRTFGLVAKNEKRIIDCYILKAEKSANHLRTKGGDSSCDITPASSNKHIINESVNLLVDVLQTTLASAVINETGIDYNIDISFPSDFIGYSSADIQNFLKKKGLTLSPSKKEMEIVVIADVQ